LKHDLLKKPSGDRPEGFSFYRKDYCYWSISDLTKKDMIASVRVKFQSTQARTKLDDT